MSALQKARLIGFRGHIHGMSCREKYERNSLRCISEYPDNRFGEIYGEYKW